MNEKPKIIAIVGATATGKSGLAVRLARAFRAQIISADSRQVYKGLDLGSGKITPEEMHGIPHYLLDIASPKKVLTAEDFKKKGEKAIREIIEAGSLPIVVGGSGFYIDTLLQGFGFPNVPANSKLRKILEKKSAAKLFEMLKRLDPERAETIDDKNKVRLVRAIEIAKTLGKVPALKQDSKYDVLWIGLAVMSEDLKLKIKSRLLERIREGMIEEARELHEKGLSYKRMNQLGLEYRYLAKFLNKEISKSEMIEKLLSEITKYAKRQKQWFKRNKKIKWFEPKEYKAIRQEVEKFLAA